MWQELERAAENAARDRARRAVLKAIGYEGEFPFEFDQQQQQQQPPAPRIVEQLRYWFFSTILPFVIWIIKAFFILVSILIISILSYVSIWGLIMRGLDVKSRPIFFDYSHDVGMPTGFVDMRSIKSAPWVHSCEGTVDESSINDHSDVCFNNDNMMSYNSIGDSSSDSRETNISSNGQQHAILAAGQKYFFELSLTLPESEINKQLGIFMVKVDLRSSDRTLLASSKQHSMLPFESTIVSLFRKTMLILPLSFGVLSETRTITLLSFDHYVETANNKKPMSLVEVSLGVPNPASFPATLQSIQIHSAEIRYGKEMNAIQTLLRNWQYSCAFIGIAILFMGYTLTTLSILNRRAQRYRWNTQPYADFFSDTVDDESAHDSNNNSSSADGRWMGVDIEILEEDDDDSGAWEPIDSNNNKKKETEKKAKDEDIRAAQKQSLDNLVSDDEDDDKSSNKQKSNQDNKKSFPLGKLANNEKVVGHEPLFPSKSNDDKSKDEGGSGGECSDSAGKAKKMMREELTAADMVMKG